MIRAAGHQVEYQSSQEKHWRAALEKPADLVAVAGGDGTVGKVGRVLSGRGIPIAVLPQGTANNLACTLELTEIPLQQLVAGWATARHLAFDVGVARGPWGQDTFLESLGTGLFGWTTCRFDDVGERDGGEAKDLELRSARRFLREQLQQFSAWPLQIRLDGRDLSGEFLLFEAMNARSIGPNLLLAPEADPGDGLLDVVLVSADDREKLDEHLRDQPQEGEDRPGLTVHKGKHLQVQGNTAEFHLDDQPWPDKTAMGQSYSIDVRLTPQALAFVVPRRNG
jgi:diacylglycerol kinase family enzyme